MSSKLREFSLHLLIYLQMLNKLAKPGVLYMYTKTDEHWTYTNGLTLKASSKK